MTWEHPLNLARLSRPCDQTGRSSFESDYSSTPSCRCNVQWYSARYGSHVLLDHRSVDVEKWATFVIWLANFSLTEMYNSGGAFSAKKLRPGSSYFGSSVLMSLLNPGFSTTLTKCSWLQRPWFLSIFCTFFYHMGLLWKARKPESFASWLVLLALVVSFAFSGLAPPLSAASLQTKTLRPHTSHLLAHERGLDWHGVRDVSVSVRGSHRP